MCQTKDPGRSRSIVMSNNTLASSICARSTVVPVARGIRAGPARIAAFVLLGHAAQGLTKPAK